jgi:hypothetical protein
MIKAKYHITNTEESIEVSISQPELDPESSHGDHRCECHLLASDYEKKFYAYGVDEMQCVWLGLRRIRTEIIEYEKKTGQKCEYHYFQDFEG